jgi:SPP1 gp7 family putative phage head morphogenesis protein
MPTQADLHKILASLAPTAIALLKKAGYFEGGTLGPAFWQAFMRISLAKNAEAWPIVADLFSWQGLEEGHATVAAQLEIDKTAITEATPWVKAYFKKREKEFIRLTTRTDMKRFRALTDSEATKVFAKVVDNPGVHEKVFARQLKDSYLCDGNQVRLKNIKRTESHNAASGGGYGFAKDSGATKKTWMTAGDKRVRPAHRIMQGETVAIEKPFSNGRMYPDEIGCRCWLEYGF